ncbi:MAG: DUF3084 domain-containing protein [Leptolyngbyaceae cyanobacterium T60_A2020_046]|nr:DUF3084 domain-containing protein [Leptolyngbyaceae cyanobacterium T60_A2020_046]
MATGYVLVLAVLLLGGFIATLGDRIGMRVGKARLSLFNLRPRQTATLVSILTGSVISASTLALLFGVSRQLRTGVFELEQIQTDLAEAKTELQATRRERNTIERALAEAREEQQDAQQRLQTINASLQSAVEQQQRTQAQLQQTQGDLSQRQRLLDQAQAQLDQTRGQLATVSRQTASLQAEVTQLEAERDQAIAAKDQELAEKEREIALKEQRLLQLQAQQTQLQEDVARLERQFEGLFRGNVVLARNQPLLSGLVRVDTAQEAVQAVDRLLRDANRIAVQQIAPGISPDRQVLLVSQEEVRRIVAFIDDDREYVIRLLSAANYVIGEPCVVAQGDPCIQVFFDVAPNQIIYNEGDRLATITVDTRTLTSQGLVEQFNLLIASLQFRARQDGIVGDTLRLADGRAETLSNFFGELRNIQQQVQIQAIASEPIFTTGPLRVDLIAVSNGRILASTNPPASPNDNTPTRP